MISSILISSKNAILFTVTFKCLFHYIPKLKNTSLLPLKTFHFQFRSYIFSSNNYYQNLKIPFLKNHKFYSTLQLKDTIYALSTAQGKAGIAIIRVSGFNALQVVFFFACH